MTPPCSKDPLKWETHRTLNGELVKAPAAEVRTAVWICRRRCPLLGKCRELRPTPWMIQAGVLYSGHGRPLTVDQFCRDEGPYVECGDKKGTVRGYRMHHEAAEKPCDECRRAARASKDTRRNRECRNGHLYTDATIIRDITGRRICLLCRPNCAAAKQRRAAS